MEPADIYRTVRKESTGSFRDRGSRFLAFAYRVHSTEEIREILDRLRKDHRNARHYCYAYRLGADKKTYRANDDGEPSHSAGKPILGQIRAFDLSNILIVVVRYFGGTLLGVGGLIKAYHSAAADALKNAEIISLTENEFLTIRFPYPVINDVMKIINDEKMKIHKQDFSAECTITASVRRSRLERIGDRFLKVEGISVTGGRKSF